MKASCLCGAVTYKITGPILRPRYCHCAHCRKFSGTAYAAWGLVETAHMVVAPTTTTLGKFNSGGGLRVFCGTCGSPVWYEPTRAPEFRGIPLGAIDDGAIPAPQMHLWTQSKVDWAALTDGLPQHATGP